jgi:hypothetical protein
VPGRLHERWPLTQMASFQPLPGCRFVDKAAGLSCSCAASTRCVCVCVCVVISHRVSSTVYNNRPRGSPWAHSVPSHCELRRCSVCMMRCRRGVVV